MTKCTQVQLLHRARSEDGRIGEAGKKEEREVQEESEEQDQGQRDERDEREETTKGKGSRRTKGRSFEEADQSSGRKAQRLYRKAGFMV